MTSRNVVRFFSTALIAALAYGCDDKDTVGPSGGFLLVDPLFAGVDQGSTEQLSATLNGVAVPVTWQSDDEAIASVSASGVVTGVNPGRVAITATLVSDPTQQRSASISVLALLGTRLTSGVPVTNVSSGTLSRGESIIYHISVPEGASTLQVTFTGGSGDGDIFVTPQVPSDDPDNWGTEGDVGGCTSWNAANAENCVIQDPQPGTWYVVVGVYDPFAGATLTGTVNP